jgi:carbon storage regulator CsrA
MIGDDIRVTFIGMRNGNARLAIAAPKDVKVLREELLERNDHDNEGHRQ